LIKKKIAEKDEDKVEAETMDVEPKEIEKKEKKIVKPEVESEILKNPARVTPSQLPFVSFGEDTRYVPITEAYGIVLLKDTKPEEKEELLEKTNSKVEDNLDSGNEPEAPDAFQFLG